MNDLINKNLKNLKDSMPNLNQNQNGNDNPDNKAPNQDDPNAQNSQPDKDQQGQGLSELDKLSKKFQRLEQGTQQRINALTSENKKLKEQLEQMGDHSDSNLKQYEETYQKLSDEQKTLNDEMFKAIDDGDSQKALKLQNKIRKNDDDMRSIEFNYKQAKEKAEDAKLTKKQEKNMSIWTQNVQKASEFFPELINEDGSINENSPLSKKVYELLMSNAKEASFTKGFIPNLNPMFDHANGFFEAAFLAERQLKSDGNSQQIKKQEDNRNINDLAAQPSALDRNNSQGASQSDKAMNDLKTKLQKGLLDENGKKKLFGMMRAKARSQNKKE